MRTRPAWHDTISQPVHDAIIDEHDVRIPMRDGLTLAADVHRPDANGKFPALIAFQPWGKDHDAFGRTFPRQRRPSPLWDGALEGGDTDYLVPRGYVHVVVDARGTGDSDGELVGMFSAGAGSEGPDIYDTVEWLAEQEWCDGNVGMIGISYLAAVQLLAAAENPPHLKAVFPEAGHYDPYRLAYHGGILWQMPRAAMRGRGGDSSIAIAEPFSFTRRHLGEEAFAELLNERLQDPDLRYHPNYHQLLRYPDVDPIWLDYIINSHDGWFWQGAGTLDERIEKIKIPVHLGVQFGRGWQLDETLKVFEGLSGPKKLMVRPGPPMQERPFHEFHDEIVRWYDHWLKGNDTGMLDEAPVQIALEGSGEVLELEQWPPAVDHVDLFLRPGGNLSNDPEILDATDAPPDGFFQPAQRVSSAVGSVTYTSDAAREDIDLVGPAALHLYAEIDQPDTNWIVTVTDVRPDGSESQLTTGWLKASHREVLEDKSTDWHPVHPHTRSVPVPVGEIVHYPIYVFPFVCRVSRGHRLRVTIKSVEDAGSVNKMLPPESGHLNPGRSVTHKLYRDGKHRSRLVLPILRRD